MFTQWKVTSAIHLLLPVLVLSGLITSCAPGLISPTGPNSSMVFGRVVITNEFSGSFGALPTGVVYHGIEVEIESQDGSQFFKPTTDKEGYFFIPNIPKGTYTIISVRFEGIIDSNGGKINSYKLSMRRLNFATASGNTMYIGSLFIDLPERRFNKEVRELYDNKRAKAYFLRTHGESEWARQEFVGLGAN